MAVIRHVYTIMLGYLPTSQNLSEIKLALLNITLKRCLETLSVLFWLFCIVFFPMVSYPLLLLVVNLSFKNLSFESFLIVITAIIIYLSWIWILDTETIHKGGRRSKLIQKLPVWKRMNEYFPIKIVKSSEWQLDRNKNYLFCNHPHGLLCLGAFGAFIGEGNPDREKLFGGFEFSALTFDQTFLFPLLREISMSMGVCSVSKQSMNYILNRDGGGNVGVMAPGGAEEALDFCPGKYVLRLKNRKGFIKVALENGASLVPVFSFGENVTFSQIKSKEGSLLRRLQDWIQSTFKVPPVLFYGRGIFQNFFGFLPRRIPITVVVGAPIHVEKTKESSQAQIDELHAKYVESVTKLFYQFRAKYSPDSKDILVIT